MVIYTNQKRGVIKDMLRINKLGRKTLLKIITQLSPEELLPFMIACKIFYAVSGDNLYWLLQLTNLLGLSYLPNQEGELQHYSPGKFKDIYCKDKENPLRYDTKKHHLTNQYIKYHSPPGEYELGGLEKVLLTIRSDVSEEVKQNALIEAYNSALVVTIKIGDEKTCREILEAYTDTNLQAALASNFHRL
jgi:hypothetical protein